MPARNANRGKMLKAGAVLICAGLFYGYALIPLGFRLACPFRALTGLKCPGCGVTEMCLNILSGRFIEAACCNWGLAAASPLLLWLSISPLAGSPSPRRKRAEEALAAVLLIALAAWGIARNLMGV